MILYHGSNIPVLNPSINYSIKYCDFGKGFYLSKSFVQAKNRAKRGRNIKGYVTTFIINMDNMSEKYKIKVFKDYNIDWFDYIKRCRSTPLYVDEYDIVMGPTADNQVLNILAEEELGKISEIDAINELKFKKSYYQVCIKNQLILDKHLKLRDYMEV